jgi:hypothetical protein
MKQKSFRRATGEGIGSHGHPGRLVLYSFCGALALTGCRTPAQYEQKADQVADKIIGQKQQEALAKTEPFSIERPSDILRRRLLEEQGLPQSSAASQGTDKLEPIAHWPREAETPQVRSVGPNTPADPNQELKLTLLDALQVGAYNSPDYQSRKEDVFRSALALDLQRNNFRTILAAGGDSEVVTDTSRNETITTVSNSASVGVTQVLANGVALGGALGVDLVQLLTQGGSSFIGLSADASVSIPLLRGSGSYIILEPPTRGITTRVRSSRPAGRGCAARPAGSARRKWTRRCSAS